MHKSIKQRKNASIRFKYYTLGSLILALTILALLLFGIMSNGINGFKKHTVTLSFEIDKAMIKEVSYRTLLNTALYAELESVQSRGDKKLAKKLISVGANEQLKETITSQAQDEKTTILTDLPVSSLVDQYIKGNIKVGKKLKQAQVDWINTLQQKGLIKTRFNDNLFRNGDSREPELAGLKTAILGSLYAISITLILSFGLGVGSAIYLEEFAPKNKLTSFIEVNINNLAAVPSIVFGLFGLGVFLLFFEMPRSTPLVGGLVLTLMTLPTIIIGSRAALASVPKAMKEAALGLGASPMQAVMHQQLPYALPGILTSTIIGIAQAMGETAPLLMIGMVAFIVNPLPSIIDPATALPVQVFLWANNPEKGFIELTSSAIIILLLFLMSFNLMAVIIRNKFQKKWN